MSQLKSQMSATETQQNDQDFQLRENASKSSTQKKSQSKIHSQRSTLKTDDNNSIESSRLLVEVRSAMLKADRNLQGHQGGQSDVRLGLDSQTSATHKDHY